MGRVVIVGRKTDADVLDDIYAKIAAGRRPPNEEAR